MYPNAINTNWGGLNQSVGTQMIQQQKASGRVEEDLKSHQHDRGKKREFILRDQEVEKIKSVLNWPTPVSKTEIVEQIKAACASFSELRDYEPRAFIGAGANGVVIQLKKKHGLIMAPQAKQQQQHAPRPRVMIVKFFRVGRTEGLIQAEFSRHGLAPAVRFIGRLERFPMNLPVASIASTTTTTTTTTTTNTTTTSHPPASTNLSTMMMDSSNLTNRFSRFLNTPAVTGPTSAPSSSCVGHPYYLSIPPTLSSTFQPTGSGSAGFGFAPVSSYANPASSSVSAFALTPSWSVPSFSFPLVEGKPINMLGMDAVHTTFERLLNRRLYKPNDIKRAVATIVKMLDVAAFHGLTHGDVHWDNIGIQYPSDDHTIYKSFIHQLLYNKTLPFSFSNSSGLDSGLLGATSSGHLSSACSSISASSSSSSSLSPPKQSALILLPQSSITQMGEVNAGRVIRLAGNSGSGGGSGSESSDSSRSSGDGGGNENSGSSFTNYPSTGTTLKDGSIQFVECQCNKCVAASLIRTNSTSTSTSTSITKICSCPRCVPILGDSSAAVSSQSNLLSSGPRIISTEVKSMALAYRDANRLLNSQYMFLDFGEATVFKSGNAYPLLLDLLQLLRNAQLDTELAPVLSDQEAKQYNGDAPTPLNLAKNWALVYSLIKSEIARRFPYVDISTPKKVRSLYKMEREKYENFVEAK